MKNEKEQNKINVLRVDSSIQRFPARG